MENTATQNKLSSAATITRKDIHQHVTDTILQQLEKGCVPWHKPWIGEDCSLLMPRNFTTSRKYNGINILLLWCSAIENNFSTGEWASFKQWQDKKELIRKGEKGTMIIYCDTFEKEVDGETKEIPFLKSSIVFNRCQLASYNPKETRPAHEILSLYEKIDAVDEFVATTGAKIVNGGPLAFYFSGDDTIYLPKPEDFITTDTCTATEGYYSVQFHELTHWTGNAKRLDRTKGKKFGDENYAIEELVAELGAAFLCAEFEICSQVHDNHAAYIGHWLKALKENKHFIFTAASEASKAVTYLKDLQPVK